MSNSIDVAAPARVHLYLRVLGRRPDGFHDVIAIPQQLDLADQLRLREAPGREVVVECSDPRLPTGEANWAHRAATTLLAWMKSSAGLRIRIDKHIPVGAGLGG